MTTDPEQATIADLFRLMTKSRSELAEFRTEVNGELEAIRTTLDNETATFKQVEVVEGRTSLLEDGLTRLAKETRDTRTQLTSEMRKIREALGKDGVKV